MTPLRIFAVRHSLSLRNTLRPHEREMSGFTESTFPLSNDGKNQAPILAAALLDADLALPAIFSSPYARAMQTAAAISKAIPKAPNIVDYRLVEVDEAGGEAWTEVERRMRGFLDRVNDRYAGRDVIAVSHGLALLALRKILLGLTWPEIEALRADIQPAGSFTIYEAAQGGSVSASPFQVPRAPGPRILSRTPRRKRAA